MDARKPLAVLTAQRRRRTATGSFKFTMPYAFNKQTQEDSFFRIPGKTKTICLATARLERAKTKATPA